VGGRVRERNGNVVGNKNLLEWTKKMEIFSSSCWKREFFKYWGIGGVKWGNDWRYEVTSRV
jgi:hypothetical protein